MAAAIETEDLTKDFLVGFWRPRPHRALDGVSLRVDQGEVFGFLGPNGAGKSTTLKLLMQLLYPTRGSARILGRPAGDLAMRRRIGFLAENPYYYDYLTAEELLRYFGRLFGLSGAELSARVDRVLNDVGLGADRQRRLRQFSKGMVQRVGLAQALLNDPEVVFLDEPMSGLDPLGRRQVRDLILGLRKRGCTVFFSSHILSDAEALCDRVAIIVKGRLVKTGRINEIMSVDLKGWELVVSDLSEAAAASIKGRARHITRLSDGHALLELPPSTVPEQLMHDLGAQGVRSISLNPIRETLEDVFVESVAAASSTPSPGA